MIRTVGLIPARSGSERIKNKNIQEVYEHWPMITKAVSEADYLGGKENAIPINNIIVSSDSKKYLNLIKGFKNHGHRTHIITLKRPKKYAQADSPDIEWIKDALTCVQEANIGIILRPTNPFRTADTIQRALKEFIAGQPCDSLRAVESVKQHPHKMWSRYRKDEIIPFTKFSKDNKMYLQQTDICTRAYAQNGCIEIFWINNIAKYGNHAGGRIIPFFTKGYEGFDINTPDDLEYARWLVEQGKVGKLKL